MTARWDSGRGMRQIPEISPAQTGRIRLRSGDRRLLAIGVAAVLLAAVLDGTLWSEPQVTIDADAPARVSAEAGTSVPTLPQGQSDTPSTAAPGGAVEAVVVPDVPAAPIAERLDNARQISDTVPPPYRWTGPIPNYRGRGACTADEATVITAAYIAAGAELDTLVWALELVSRESGCDHTVRNVNARTRDDSYSLCQLNARAGHFGSHGVLAGWDPQRTLVDLPYAAAACAEMWRQCGRLPWRYGNYGCAIPEDLR